MMNTIWTLIYKNQGWLVSVGWVLLLSLFTYTDLFCNMARTDIVFSTAYIDVQAHVISLVVNIGLLCMLVFDFMSIGKPFTNKVVGMLMLEIVFPVLLFSIATVQNSKEIVNYIDLVKSPLLLYVLHLLFLSILTWLKKQSMEDGENVQTVKRTFV